jgi:tetratricopeptide (TPR) repeat protein
MICHAIRRGQASPLTTPRPGRVLSPRCGPSIESRAVRACWGITAWHRSRKRADVPFESDTAPVGFKGPTAGQPRGWVHYNRGAYDEAEPIIRKAAELANRSAPIQYHLGMTYYRLGKKDEAVLALRRALQVDPKFPEAARAREVLSMLGQ